MTYQDEDAELLSASGAVLAYGSGLRSRLSDLVVHPLDEEAAERVRAELAGELDAGRDRQDALASLAWLRQATGPDGDGEQSSGGGAA